MFLCAYAGGRNRRMAKYSRGMKNSPLDSCLSKIRFRYSRKLTGWENVSYSADKTISHAYKPEAISDGSKAKGHSIWRSSSRLLSFRSWRVDTIHTCLFSIKIINKQKDNTVIAKLETWNTRFCKEKLNA